MTEPSGRGMEIWRRLEGATTPAATTSTAPPGPAPKTPKAPTRIWRVLDVVGIAIWLYFPLKIFVADVDQAVVSTFAPSLLPFLGYRIVFYLLLLIVAVLTFRRFGQYVLYVVM
jgi:hypothetical protein